MAAAPFADRKKMTYLGEAVARHLRTARRPLIEDRDIWTILTRVYADRSVSHLRGEHPTDDTLRRIKTLLRAERIIVRDHDYKRFWRVAALPDIEADALTCLVDPGTCLSHLSAMQAFHLTERRPLPLYITVAHADAWPALAAAAENGNGATGAIPVRHHHPSMVRGRTIVTTTKRLFPPTIDLRSGNRRVTTVGQTFLDMLERPDHCGGMAHVLEVMDRHAKTYLAQIVPAIDAAADDVTKVRAGYILQERLGFDHPAITAWASRAQRGGSRKLDPRAGYAPRFSETWMISLNV